MKMNCEKHSLIIVALVLVCIQQTTAKISVDVPATLVRLKQNVDEAQTYLLSVWRGTIGGIAAFGIFYSFWLILGAFYYSFAMFYKAKKDDEGQRSFSSSVTDMLTTSVYNGLVSVRDRNDRLSGDPCFRAGFCYLKSYITNSGILESVPSFVRKAVRMDPVRSAGKVDCAALNPGCTLQNIFFRLLNLRKYIKIN